jgi:hypothetical protein
LCLVVARHDDKRFVLDHSDLACRWYACKSRAGLFVRLSFGSPRPTECSADSSTIEG